MAKTYQLRSLSVRDSDSDYLSNHVERFPEGASQTFVPGSPVMLASGLVVKWTTTNKILGFAVRAGQNTTGAECEVIVMHPGLSFYANLVSGADPEGTPYALLAADLGVKYDLAEYTLADGSVIWAVNKAGTTDENAQGISLFGDIVLPNVMRGELAVAGDFNARLEFIIPALERVYD
jgi:hypothetical protein